MVDNACKSFQSWSVSSLIELCCIAAALQLEQSCCRNGVALPESLLCSSAGGAAPNPNSI